MNRFLLMLVVATATTSCGAAIHKNNTTSEHDTDTGVALAKGVAADSKAFEIKGTEVHSVISTINEKSYELYVKLPTSYPNSEELYPVLVLTDADYSFPLVTSIARRLDTEEFIIVGISYSKGDTPGVSRTRDYTPTYAPNEPRGHSQESRLASGKADNFIAFIRNDVFPFLEKSYRVDMSRKVFAGHSFGGLLASYMLVTSPSLFEYYLAGSPSLWYDNFCLNRFEEAYSKTHSSLKANLFLCIGGEEDSNGSAMVAEMAGFERRLLSRSYSGLRIKSVILSGEDH